MHHWEYCVIPSVKANTIYTCDPLIDTTSAVLTVDFGFTLPAMLLLCISQQALDLTTFAAPVTTMALVCRLPLPLKLSLCCH